MTSREGQPPTAPEKLVAAWEEAYREYSSDAEADVDVCLEVATAWRALAESTELPWWLSAAVRSAAEAFERQGQACRAWPGNGVAISLPRQSGGDRTRGGAPLGAGEQDVDDGRRTRATQRAGRRCTCSLARQHRVLVAATDTRATA